MLYSRFTETSRGFLGLTLLALCGATLVGCDNSTGTPPVLSEGEIQQRQTNEAEARAKAFGKKGAPTSSRGAAKAAAKAADKAPEPAAEKPAP
ncbi:MAG: hypothetical protein BGO49_12680 [Planctomycetales bacterium 71-10]|nr:MAG: hypothetical protein BGO49_12680 [Planctomycetales bacterium 71-10]